MSAEELRIAPWYKGTVTDADSIDLSETEYANLETILAYEAEMGYNQ